MWVRSVLQVTFGGLGSDLEITCMQTEILYTEPGSQRCRHCYVHLSYSIRYIANYKKERNTGTVNQGFF